MDFAAELGLLTAQIPRGRVVTCGDLGILLGDPVAARAVFRTAIERADLPNRHRIVNSAGRPVVPRSGAKLRTEGIALEGGRVPRQIHVGTGRFATSRPLAALRGEQEQLRQAVRFRDEIHSIRTVAGVDLAYGNGFAIASAFVCAFPSGGILDSAAVREPVRFPYIPGYLAYRESPAILRCLDGLDARPDIVLIDGHGVLHPARFGLASLVGVRRGISTIGCAKSLLVGRLDRMPAPRRSAPILLDGRLLGQAIRPGRPRRLVYVSVGHAISLPTAVRVVRALCRTAVPEPLRLAHEHATELRKKMTKTM